MLLVELLDIEPADTEAGGLLAETSGTALHGDLLGARRWLCQMEQLLVTETMPTTLGWPGSSGLGRDHCQCISQTGQVVFRQRQGLSRRGEGKTGDIGRCLI